MNTSLKNILASSLKKNVPNIKPGDTVRVHQIVKEGNKERVQVFEGIIIACKHGNGITGTFTVRKISFGFGVERIFPLHSPRILKVERIKSSQVRRNKLYYLRKLTGKAARMKNEKQDYAVWEEKGAEEELEKIAEAVAEDAEARAEEKAEEEGSVIIEENKAMTDEEKAAIAAGKTDDITDNEAPEEVQHNEKVVKAE
jgi:large subunit ribosomal protein L19